MTLLHFSVIRRCARAKGLVPAIRRYSKQFRNALAVGDEEKMRKASKEAWSALTQLFEILRGEADDGYLAQSWMMVDTALIAEPVSASDQQKMLQQKKIDRAKSKPLSLRNTLNKIAHYQGNQVAFRVDGRNAHYLLLGGTHKGKRWVAEILVSKLCKNAAKAIQQIT